MPACSPPAIQVARCTSALARISQGCRCAFVIQLSLWTRLTTAPDPIEIFPMESKTLNQTTLAILAPLLMLTGIAGFLIPERYSPLSGATPYNLFHLIFGAIGLLLLSAKNDLWASLFNFLFGLIDLYQVLASVVGLTPIQYFHWTYADDVVHVLLGFALVIIGGYGLFKWK